MKARPRLPVGDKARTRAKARGKAGELGEAAEKENREDNEKIKKVPAAL